MQPPRHLPISAVIGAAAAIGFTVSVYGFAPGAMTPDATDIFDSGRTLNFNDWHSPTMQLLWGTLDRVAPGPLGMLLLIQACYWIGFALIGIGLARRGWRTLGVVVVLLALFPPSLHMSSILLKDTAMAGFLLVAVGLMVLSTTVAWRCGMLVGAVIFICLATAMRPNAFAATLPLIVLWIACLRQNAGAPWWSWGVSALAAVSLFLVITNAERFILKPRQGHVERALMIFDLAGITYFSHRDQFGGILGAGFIERNSQSCYDGRAWDVYAWGQCKDVDAVITKTWTPAELTTRWATAAADETLAYISHRITHFGILMRSSTYYSYDILYGADEKPYAPSPIYSFVEANAVPLYAKWRPFVWCGLLLSMLALTITFRDRFMAGLVFCVASSGLSYIGLYLLIGVSADWRYGYWTQLVTTISLVICAFVILRSMKSQPTPERSAQAILAIFANQKLRTNDVHLMSAVHLEFIHDGGRTEDWETGLQYAIERGWLEPSPNGTLKLTVQD